MLNFNHQLLETAKMLNNKIFHADKIVFVALKEGMQNCQFPR
jgi:hypothetical protein